VASQSSPSERTPALHLSSWMFGRPGSLRDKAGSDVWLRPRHLFPVAIVVGTLAICGGFLPRPFNSRSTTWVLLIPMLRSCLLTYEDAGLAGRAPTPFQVTVLSGYSRGIRWFNRPTPLSGGLLCGGWPIDVLLATTHRKSARILLLGSYCLPVLARSCSAAA